MQALPFYTSPFYMYIFSTREHIGCTPFVDGYHPFNVMIRRSLAFISSPLMAQLRGLIAEKHKKFCKDLSIRPIQGSNQKYLRASMETRFIRDEVCSVFYKCVRQPYRYSLFISLTACFYLCSECTYPYSASYPFCD